LPKPIDRFHHLARRALFAAALAAVALLGPAGGTPSASAQQFRGVWVNAWGKGIKTPEQVDQLVKLAAEGGLNAILVQVRKRADAYYNSSLEPKAQEIAPEFDPLACVIEKAHAKGIQVHAWFVVYPAASASQAALPTGHVLLSHPDWVTANAKGIPMQAGSGEGVYLDPGLPEVQDYIVSVARDLVSRYAVDGLHLDYIRYPGRNWGYNPESVRRFEEETGHTPSGDPVDWDNWRRGQVTQLVARIRNAISEARPGVKLSAAVFADQNDAFKNRLQDWGAWVRNGLVDFVVPMNYATSRALFASRSKAAYTRNPRASVFMGVGGGNKPSSTVLAQVRLLQALGVPGIVIYHYAGADEAFWRNLGSTVFRSAKGG